MIFIASKRAYTLIELMIVMVIIVLMLAFGVPAFQRYGHQQAFKQKIEEVTALMNMAYTKARNPEKGAMAYEVSAATDGSKFVLKKCSEFDPSSTRCTTDSTKYEIIKEVDMLKGEIIQGGSNPFLMCTASASYDCTFDSSKEFSFRDDNLATLGTVSFTIATPFNVLSTRRD